MFREGKRLTEREWLSEMFTEVEDEGESFVDLPASQDRENECRKREERGGDGEVMDRRGRGTEVLLEHERGCLSMWGEIKEQRRGSPRYEKYPGKRDASSWQERND